MGDIPLTKKRRELLRSSAWTRQRIRSLQVTRDYAAPELVPLLNTEIDRLIRSLDEANKRG